MSRSPTNSVLLQVLEDAKHHVGSELLGSQTIATSNANDVGSGQELEGGGDFQEQRLTLRTLLLGREMTTAAPMVGENTTGQNSLLISLQ